MANQVLYGFHSLKDVYNERITDAMVPVVSNAVDASVAEHNRQMAALLNLFAMPTTEYKQRYKTAQAARLQPLDENGRPRPIKRAGYYDVAFPIRHAGVSIGWDYEARVKKTVREANDDLAILLDADKRWVRDHILAALLTNTSYTYTDPQYGSLTVKGIANADTDTYLIFNGSDAGATEQHFVATASAIADAANPFPSIYTDLTEHPENGGMNAKVISLVASNISDEVQALTAFKEANDPDVTPGNASDTLTGRLNVAVPGTTLGKVNKVWAVEWPTLPDNYIISVAYGGDKPLAMREHPEEELRGFRRRGQRSDHPFYEDIYDRYAGFGAWNRVGARVDYFGGGSYAIPTGYTAPLG